MEHLLGGRQQENNNDNACEVDMDLSAYDSSRHDNGLNVESGVHASSSEQCPEGFPIDLIDVDIDEIPEGPIPSQDNRCIAIEHIRSTTTQENSLHPKEHPTFEAKRVTIQPSLEGKPKLN